MTFNNVVSNVAQQLPYWVRTLFITLQFKKHTWKGNLVVAGSLILWHCTILFVAIIIWWRSGILPQSVHDSKKNYAEKIALTQISSNVQIQIVDEISDGEIVNDFYTALLGKCQFTLHSVLFVKAMLRI